VYISEKQLLVLNFRGLSFEFRIDPKLEVSEKFNEFAAGLCYDVTVAFAFSALTLLVGCQEEHPVCEN